MNEIIDAVFSWFASIGPAFNAFIDAILAWVDSIDPVLRTVIAGLAIMLETSVLIGLVVPGDTVVLAAGLGVQDIPQLIWLVIAVVIGALIGESIGFLIGRWFGPRLRASKLGQRIGETNWERADAYLERRGGWAVFLSRFLPVLHSLVPVTVGMSRMRYATFIAWTLPACLIWSIAYSSVSFAARTNYEALKGQLHYAGYILVGAILLFIVIVTVVKKVLSKRQEKFMAETAGAPVEVAAETTKGGTEA